MSSRKKKPKPASSARSPHDQRACIESRRWALITTWQIERYTDAADSLGVEMPTWKNIDTARDYYQRYDRVIAEAHFLAAAATELAGWLRRAKITRNGDRGSDVAIIRRIVDGWNDYCTTEKGRPQIDRTVLLDARRLFGVEDTKTVLAAVTSLADEATGLLKNTDPLEV